jgi:hypothetical protein
MTLLDRRLCFFRPQTLRFAVAFGIAVGTYMSSLEDGARNGEARAGQVSSSRVRHPIKLEFHSISRSGRFPDPPREPGTGHPLRMDYSIILRCIKPSYATGP